jgi:hypothetical protein
MKKMWLAAVVVILAATACTRNEADFEVGLTGDAAGIVIKRYLGEAASVRIPATIRNMPVREISEKAFAAENGSVRLTRVVIPEGVTKIGSFAFNYQGALKKVSLPATLTEIGNYAFADSGLTSVTIPASVTMMGHGVFRGTALRSIDLPAGLTELPPELFAGCVRLKSIVIPEGFTGIGREAFRGCTELSSVTLPGTIASIGGSAFGGCSSLGAVTVPDTVASLSFGYDGHVFAGCPGLPLETQALLKRLGYRGLFSSSR